MHTRFSNRTLVVIALMLFSMFFGAGNLIFPPMVGKLAGTHTLRAMFFFGITAVLLPVLGMMAVAKTRGLPNLGLRVGREFATPFTILVYMSIGPFLAIPRAASVPFEMAIAPYLPPDFPRMTALFLYTAIFFAAAAVISLLQNHVMNKVMGNILTPALLVMLAALYAASLFSAMPAYAAPAAEYAINPMSKGFIDGYLTMDTLAALNFGLVISSAIELYGINDEKKILRINIKISLLAGTILFIIYTMLADLGAKSATVFPDTTNGAQILVLISDRFFGRFGAVMLALIFTLACLTTCIGLIASISRYFSSLLPHLNYAHWLIIWTLVSFLFANIGLDGILKYNIPVLTAIYPVSIMLIVLALAAEIIGTAHILYRSTVYTTAVIATLNAFDQSGVRFAVLSSLVQKLPFYDIGLGWIIPAFAVLVCSAFIEKCIRHFAL